MNLFVLATLAADAAKIHCDKHCIMISDHGHAPNVSHTHTHTLARSHARACRTGLCIFSQGLIHR